MIALSWGKANDVKGWPPWCEETLKGKYFRQHKRTTQFYRLLLLKISLSRLLTVDQFDLRDVTLARENLWRYQRNRFFAKVQSAYLSGFTLNFFRGRGEC